MDKDTIIERFRNHLRSQGLKVTKEREKILEEVILREDHFDADEFAADLRLKGARVSRATVYRTLDILYDIGAVEKSTLGHKHQHFENMVGREHHDHLICDLCEKVIEFHNEEIEELQEKVCRENGFKITRHSLQLFGICPACQDEAGDSTKQESLA